MGTMDSGSIHTSTPQFAVHEGRIQEVDSKQKRSPIVSVAKQALKLEEGGQKEQQVSFSQLYHIRHALQHRFSGKGIFRRIVKTLYSVFGSGRKMERKLQEAIVQRFQEASTAAKEGTLSSGEAKEIYEYLHEHYPAICTVRKTLTKKIRTNQEITSFITNLFRIGKSNSHLNYEDVSIEYFDNFENAKSYMQLLCSEKGWKSITFTDSTYKSESISQLATICDFNAHDVIGQEFDKVVFVMDNNFGYLPNGQLAANHTYYSLEGMLYQIVTRVVNELKIIVLNNPVLYGKLLEIKALDNRSENNA